jgi:fructokinase
VTEPFFTAIGEILIDFTPIVEAGRTVGFRMHPGGSPLNVAVGLARLGGRAEFAGKVSTDFFGRFLRVHLEHEGVGTRFLSSSDAPTTLAFVALEAGEPAFSFYQDGTADTLLRPADIPMDIATTRILHFGSISLLREPTASTITGLVERLRGGPLLSFDPNIRPGQIHRPVEFRLLVERLASIADLIKVSAADLRWLAPDRGFEAAAGDLLNAGSAVVVVTMGADGCFVCSRRFTLRLPAPRVDVVDTVGAGDAFTAGLLISLSAREVASRGALDAATSSAVEESLRFALAAAALTCMRSSADPPTRPEVEQFLAQSA